MAQNLDGLKVAVLATDGVEQIELTEPMLALQRAGAETTLVSIKPGEIQGFHHLDRADRFPVQQPVDQADPQAFDALVLPGGVANPDALRTNPKAVQFVRSFFEYDKPVAAICHGPWMLVEAGVTRDRTLTSWPSLQTDIRNAGGHWVDQQVRVDGNLVTSRKPDDLPAFNQAMIERFANSREEKAQLRQAIATHAEEPRLGAPTDESLLDKTVADSFPASDPISSLRADPPADVKHG